MEVSMSKAGWIGAAAAIAAGTALFYSSRLRGVRARFTPEHEIAFDKVTEVGRVGPGTGLGTLAVLAVGALAFSQMRREDFGQREGARGMHSVEETIEVEVPVRAAYNQWTQFEEFPRFMATVEEVRQLDDTHLHWKANVAGKTKEWDSEITEQIPDQRISWRSTSGVRNAGTVTFDKIAENRTRVRLMMEYWPESADEKIGGALGGVKMTAKGNLKKFKALVEQRGVESGAWRGEVHNGQTTS
jgi:uncharacterized membrane protein